MTSLASEIGLSAIAVSKAFRLSFVHMSDGCASDVSKHETILTFQNETSKFETSMSSTKLSIIYQVTWPPTNTTESKTNIHIFVFTQKHEPRTKAHIHDDEVYVVFELNRKRR